MLPLKRTIIACLIFLSLITFWVYQRLNPSLPHPNPIQKVEITPVKTQTWQQTLKSTGTLKAVQGVVLKTEVEGRIKTINFESGSQVQAGAVLVELENDSEKADVDSAQAQLSLSQLNYKRESDLIKTHTVTGQDYDQSVTTLEADQAALEKAEATYNQTVIKAPFAGRLGIIDLQPGDYVDQGQVIVNLANINSLNVDFSIPEVYMSDLAVGSSVELKSSSYPKLKFYGKVTATETMTDPDTRSIQVRATFDNSKHLLLPGNFVEVKLFAGNKKQVLTVPQTALQYSEKGNYVYKVVNGVAIKTPVREGGQLKQVIIISSGLKAGDKVVSAGVNKIHNGSKVAENI